MKKLTLLRALRLLMLALATFSASSIRAQTKDITSTLAPLKFTATGELEIQPSATSSQNDFDYLVGKWVLKDKKLKSRLTNSTEWIEFESTVEMHKLLNGIGNMDTYKTTVDGKPFEGVALRLFNPKTRLWSIYWADSNVGAMDPPMVGSFDGNIGKFFCKDKYKGKDIIVLFHWDKTDPEKPVWSQAFSPDNGKTWEVNATNTSYRQKQESSSSSKIKKGMIKVAIFYPNGEGKTFNMDYYSTKHMPLAATLFGSSLKAMAIDKGLANAATGEPVPYLAIGYFYFDTMASFQSAMGPNSEKLRADVPNYTNIKPVIQISEVQTAE